MDLLELAEAMVVAVYRLLGQIRDKDFREIKNQLHRAATSVPSNIAEGMGRSVGNGGKEKARFYRIALGSLRESMSQLRILWHAKPEAEHEANEILERCFGIDERLCTELGEPPQKKELLPDLPEEWPECVNPSGICAKCEKDWFDGDCDCDKEDLF